MITIKSLPATLDTAVTGLVYPKPGTDCYAVKPSCPVTIFVWDKARVADPEQGYWVCCVDKNVSETHPTGVELYPNNEFELYYEIDEQGCQDNVSSDRVFALLTWFKFTTGETVEVVHATKTKPVRLLGRLTETDTVQTAEGWVATNVGDYLVESPSNPGQIWPLDAATFEKRYDI